MKDLCCAPLLAIAVALLVTMVPVRAFATETEGRIETSAKKSLAQESVASLSGGKNVDDRLELPGERAVENSEACGCVGLNAGESTAVVLSH